ncbi:MAG: hypothetical protein OXL34_01390 [Gemmatimonadota bacterium]|nr:hypothetical protein [Gemmatimonadota bacterium]
MRDDRTRPASLLEDPDEMRRSGYRVDDLNRGIQDRIVRSGFAMIASTRLRGRFALRLCVLNALTTEDDVMRVLDRVLEAGRELC